MALISIDGIPILQIGCPTRQESIIPNSGNTFGQIDAADEAAIMIGHVWTSDGASHTIDTSGSSSLGWRTNSITFANAGTTVKVGLAAVAAGPPPRAANSSGTITFDVSKTLTGGGGGITSNTWHEMVPDAGTKTIANGDLVAFAIQATARAGADVINVLATSQAAANVGLPCMTQYASSTYTNLSAVPNAVITFSDGTRGYYVGCNLMNSLTLTSTTWNSGSGTKEYGNYLTLPFPCKLHGIVAAVSVSADIDLVLYSDPFGTPVAEKTISLLSGQAAVSTNSTLQLLFPTPYVMDANQPVALSFKPGGSNVTAVSRTLNSALHQEADGGGGSCYAVSRASGAFSAVNSQKDRFFIGALVQSFVHPARSGFALGI